MSVSSGYKELSAVEFAEAAVELVDAWCDPSIAPKQRALVDTELERYRTGGDVPPYRVFAELLRAATAAGLKQDGVILEVGCASGYYSEVARLAGWMGQYVGVDCSESLIVQARMHHPAGIWRVEFATALSAFGAYDLVVSGACLLHIPNWQLALHEAVRVSTDLVMFHRTPVRSGPTTYWRKDAYGVPCIEIHFGEEELLAEFAKNNLRLLESRDVGDSDEYVMRSYLTTRN